MSMKVSNMIAVLLLPAAVRADACDGIYTDEPSCDGQAECTWCKSAAVPSNCYTKSDAAGLPSSIFDCALEAVSAPADACNGVYTDETSCDGQTGCTWCKSAAVPSNCYTTSDAAGLPSSIFDCASEAVSAPADACNGVYTDETSCDGQTGCTWCKSAAVPSNCYTTSDAAGLPSSIFDCASEAVSAPADACNGVYTDETSCDGQTGCTWCKSAAVPSNCYTTSDAAGLPSSIFDCASEAVSAPADACNGVYTDETSCDGQTGCTWCKSAAVPSSCYTTSDAAGLPSSIFDCALEVVSASAVTV